MLGTGDLIKATIIFTVNVEGSNVVIAAEDNLVFMSDYGTLEWEFNLDDYYMVPNFLDLKIAATKGPTGLPNNFEKYLFDRDTPYIETEKDAVVLIEMKYAGTVDFVEEFKGKIIPKTVTSDPDTEYIIFTATPGIGILNKKWLFDLEQDPIQPLGALPIKMLLTDFLVEAYKIFNSTEIISDAENSGFEGGTVGNWTAAGNHSVAASDFLARTGSFSLQIASTGTGNGTTDYAELAVSNFAALESGKRYRVTLFCRTVDLGESVVIKIGSKTVTVNFNTSKFNIGALNFTATASELSQGLRLYILTGVGTVYIDDISFLVYGDLDLEVSHDWVFAGYDEVGDLYLDDGTFEELRIFPGEYLENPASGLRNVADIIRKLALQFGCYTGVKSTNRIFFKKFFSAPPEDVYELGDEAYYIHKKKYELPLLKYIKALTQIVGEGSFTFHAPNETAFSDAGDDYVELNSLVTFIILPFGEGFFSNVAIDRGITPDEYSVIAVKDPEFHYVEEPDEWQILFADPDFVPYGRLFVDFFLRFRGDVRYSRVDSIMAPGLKHSITRAPQFKGYIYRPLYLRKHYLKGVTEIEGIIIK